VTARLEWIRISCGWLLHLSFTFKSLLAFHGWFHLCPWRTIWTQWPITLFPPCPPWSGLITLTLSPLFCKGCTGSEVLLLGGAALSEVAPFPMQTPCPLLSQWDPHWDLGTGHPSPDVGQVSSVSPHSLLCWILGSVERLGHSCQARQSGLSMAPSVIIPSTIYLSTVILSSGLGSLMSWPSRPSHRKWACEEEARCIWPDPQSLKLPRRFQTTPSSLVFQPSALCNRSSFFPSLYPCPVLIPIQFIGLVCLSLARKGSIDRHIGPIDPTPFWICFLRCGTPVLFFFPLEISLSEPYCLCPSDLYPKEGLLLFWDIFWFRP
jgi:5-methylcytosine-specific restriction endonuclease McrA